MIKNPRIKRITGNSSFLLFITSQMASYFSDAFTMIALTALLIKITGSSKFAGFNVICIPVASLFLSSIAGSLGDRINEKLFLIIICVLKALISLAFLANYNILVVLTLMLSLASLEVVANPPRKKLLTMLLSSSDMMIGNSLLTGVMGFAYISGPLICGLAIDLWGMDLIFITNGCLYLFAGIILLFLKNTKSNRPNNLSKNHLFKDILVDFSKGIRYFKHDSRIKSIVLITAITGLFVASINVTFYSFAFDVLKVNNSLWGIMMSLFYGANFISMLFMIYFNKSIQRLGPFFISILLLLVSLIWYFYRTISSLYLILPLQLIEGLALTLNDIYLNSKLQQMTQTKYLGRIIGISDILSNLAKLLAISLTYIFLRFYPIKYIFSLNCFCLFSFTLILTRFLFKNNNKTF